MKLRRVCHSAENGGGLYGTLWQWKQATLSEGERV